MCWPVSHRCHHWFPFPRVTPVTKAIEWPIFHQYCWVSSNPPVPLSFFFKSFPLPLSLSLLPLFLFQLIFFSFAPCVFFFFLFLSHEQWKSRATVTSLWLCLWAQLICVFLYLSFLRMQCELTSQQQCWHLFPTRPHTDQCSVRKGDRQRQADRPPPNGWGHLSPRSCTVSENEQRTVSVCVLCAHFYLWMHRFFNVVSSFSSKRLPVLLLRQIHFFLKSPKRKAKLWRY